MQGFYNICDQCLMVSSEGDMKVSIEPPKSE